MEKKKIRTEQRYYAGKSTGRIFFVAVFMAIQVWILTSAITGLLGYYTYFDAAMKAAALLPQDRNAYHDLRCTEDRVFTQARYLFNNAYYPVYQNTKAVYFPEAEEGRRAQIRALRSAKKFIFMEYFSVEDKECFAEIKEILYAKAEEGVDVRLMYDDVGSAKFLSFRFVKEMESHGIKCQDFNPISAFFDIFMNNRDHRKITVIDGKIAFTGGYNLANEYFGCSSRCGTRSGAKTGPKTLRTTCTIRISTGFTAGNMKSHRRIKARRFRTNLLTEGVKKEEKKRSTSGISS